MFTSDKLIKYYEDNIKDKKIAPHTMHNAALEFAKIILADLSTLSADGSVNILKGNNIWNYVRSQLISKGFDPYTIKEDGFTDIIKKAKDDNSKN